MISPDRTRWAVLASLSREWTKYESALATYRNAIGGDDRMFGGLVADLIVEGLVDQKSDSRGVIQELKLTAKGSAYLV